MNTFVSRLVAVLALCVSCLPVYAWEPPGIRTAPDMFRVYRGPDTAGIVPIVYGIGGKAEVDDPSGLAHRYVVAAQLNGRVMSGTHDAWGVATEAWGLPETYGYRIGIEAAVIGMEPDNTALHAALAAVSKDRPDGEYENVPTDPPPNDHRVALFIDAQPGASFGSAVYITERGITPVPSSQGAVVNLASVPVEDLRDVPLFRFSDGYCQYYNGKGRMSLRPCDSAPSQVQ